MARQKLLLAVAVLVGVSAGVSFAADKTKPVVVQQVSVPSVDELARKEAEARATAKLTAQEWSIVFTPRDKKLKGFSDVLSFTPVTMTARNFSAKGFGASNYAISVMKDGTGVWETVQSNDLGEYGSWRGEVVGPGAMRGMVSFKFKSGREIYEFATTSAPVSVAPAVVSTLSTTTSKK